MAIQYQQVDVLAVTDKDGYRTTTYTGTVQELSFTTQKYVSQYIPITRFENVAGPVVPDPAGNIYRLSKTIFAYSFDRGDLAVLGTTLEAPAEWAGSEAGF